MGIGMVLVVDQEAAQRIMSGESGVGKAYQLGTVVEGQGVEYKEWFLKYPL